MAPKIAAAPAPQLTQRQMNRRAAKAEKRANKTPPNTGGGSSKGESKSGPVAEAESKQWAKQVLSGDVSQVNPVWDRLTREEDLDPTKNPLIQNIANDIQGRVKSDFLGDLDALTQASEAGGRFGGSTWQGARERSVGAANEAANQGLNQLYGGAYEAERNRQAGLAQGLFQTQGTAAGIPIAYANNATNRAGIAANRAVGMAGVGVQRGHLELAQQQAEQDAFMDLLKMYGEIGSWGGTETGSGRYVGSQNPWVAGAKGALAGYLGTE